MTVTINNPSSSSSSSSMTPLNSPSIFSPNSSFYFERKFFEPEFVDTLKEWFADNWPLSIIYSVVYVLLVHTGQRMMLKREKIHLHRSLVAWNIVLAVFSILGTLRFWPDFVLYVYDKGFAASICHRITNLGLIACWIYFFAFSKMIELIDTSFIIMRKQKLMFLHWYHHATVLVYTWFSVAYQESTGLWFGAMNYFVHSLMYSYYACRAARCCRIPKYVNVLITSLQLSQMLVGLVVNLTVLWMKSRGNQCDTSYENIYASFLMYFTYFLLFAAFFRDAYLRRGGRGARIASASAPADTAHIKVIKSN